jgi:hypothetical protein
MISGEESLRAVTRGVFGVIGLEIEGGPCLDGVFGVGLVELVFLVVFEALEGFLAAFLAGFSARDAGGFDFSTVFFVDFEGLVAVVSSLLLFLTFCIGNNS